MLLACTNPLELLLPVLLWLISGILGLAALTISTSSPTRAFTLAVISLTCWLLIAVFSLPELAVLRAGPGAWIFALAPAAPSALGITFAARARKHMPPDPRLCRICNYSLHGLIEPRCPECGTPFAAQLLRPPPKP